MLEDRPQDSFKTGLTTGFKAGLKTPQDSLQTGLKTARSLPYLGQTDGLVEKNQDLQRPTYGFLLDFIVHPMNFLKIALGLPGGAI